MEKNNNVYDKVMHSCFHNVVGYPISHTTIGCMLTNTYINTANSFFL